MKLVAVFAILCVAALAAAARHPPYKNKRIIKVRVPPRPYPQKQPYPRPPLRYPSKYPRPVGSAYVKLRPPPVTTFKHNFHLTTYGGGFPYKVPVKFPSVKDEVHTTPAPLPSPSPPPQPQPSPPSPPPLAQQQTFYSSPHVQSSEENSGPIKEIPAPNLGPKPVGDAFLLDGSGLKSPGLDVGHFLRDGFAYGKGPSLDVTHLVHDDGGGQISFPASEYYTAFGHGFDVDNHLTASFDKDAGSATTPPPPSPPVRGSGYEVTEESHGSGSEGATSSSQLHVYAPDPDPSSPVHKVPPTKVANVAETYVPNLGHGFRVPTPATLSTQELYRLMHGYAPQAIVGEPVVTILGQPQAAGVILQPNYGAQAQYSNLQAQYAQYLQGIGAQYAQGQYLPQQFVDAHQRDATQIIVQEQPVYAPYAGQQQQQQQQPYTPQYQTYDAFAYQQSGDGDYQQAAQSYQQGSHSYQQGGGQSYQESGQSYRDSAGSYPYEPEASETAKLGILSKMDEESVGQGNALEATPVPADDRIILNFGKLAEVPFYSTLPSKEAAEAFARLQAAGSIASNYVDKIKAMEEDEEEEEEEDGDASPDLGLPRDELHKPQKVDADGERVAVDVQESVPLYETTYSASSLLDESGAETDVNLEERRKEAFGHRIRPK